MLRSITLTNFYESPWPTVAEECLDEFLAEVGAILEQSAKPLTETDEDAA